MSRVDIRWKSVAMGLALSVAAMAAHADGALRFQPRHASDVKALLRALRPHPLIVELWALDCSDGRENIARIAQWRRASRQRVDVVMVAMDGPEQAAMLNRALAPLVRDARIGLAHVPQYANAEAMPERLRAALDPGWQGELPRTLILRTDGRRHASSGLLTPQTLDAALRDQTGRNGRNGARRPPSLLGYGGGRALFIMAPLCEFRRMLIHKAHPTIFRRQRLKMLSPPAPRPAGFFFADLHRGRIIPQLQRVVAYDDVGDGAGVSVPLPIASNPIATAAIRMAMPRAMWKTVCALKRSRHGMADPASLPAGWTRCAACINVGPRWQRGAAGLP
ncbi:hypothetical protein CJO78_22555 (plasmid) [Ralstonia solanacearum]|nr:hypothetical protein CJO78_22555 [Ralstonia solanacearum]AXW08524.1 hypothetical protein CJO82_22230 [Ralstonia solanacearum]AXW26311.1 hypothetical protein CJO86_22495 [Ralstonia solanacearum]AXW83224.1 hypothetical protein CJO98_22590 [Ralstonia solanacearum]